MASTSRACPCARCSRSARESSPRERAPRTATRATRATAADARAQLDLAELATAGSSAEEKKAAASCAVLAGIAAADAACCKSLGRRSRSQDHRDAVALVRQVAPGGADAAKQLERLLGLKDQAQYGFEDIGGQRLPDRATSGTSARRGSPSASRSLRATADPFRKRAYFAYAAQKRPTNAKRTQPPTHRAPRKARKSRPFLRALCRTRTGDPFLTMEVLYQLS